MKDGSRAKLLVFARTYALALVINLIGQGNVGRIWRKGRLLRDAGPTGFAFAMAVAVGGGRVIQEHLPAFKAPEWQKSFLANILSSSAAITLLFRSFSKRTAWSFDLTLFLVVRAADSLVSHGLLAFADHSDGDHDHKRRTLKARQSMVDSLLFQLSSARIMWCFFYLPHLLPKAYHKWINALARVDDRLTHTLRLIHSRDWLYSTGSTSHRTLLTSYAKDLGYPASWGDPYQIPNHGGKSALNTWKAMDVPRGGIGGIPCELVHGTVTGSSCTANASLRFFHAIPKALLIYLPVHIIPALLRLRTVPSSKELYSLLLPRITGAFRSSAFLSTFLAAFYYAVCMTRTIVPSFIAKMSPSLAQLFTNDFIDGPYGCILAGSLACGGSIWIEDSRRRGEMALYVLPRALETIFSQAKGRAGGILERGLCTLCLAYLLTSAAHTPETLRGLSGWSLGLVLKPDVKNKKEE